MGNRFIIGGEFTLEPGAADRVVMQTVEGFVAQHHPGYFSSMTGGGYYSLKVILRHLRERGLTDRPVLLPSYLCPTILIPFRELNIPFSFYPVDEQLAPSRDALLSLISHPASQTLLFIPYFGFRAGNATEELLLQLSESGLTIIEDRAQCLFPDFSPIGDFIFYSFRKFLPVDGSVLLSKEELTFTIDHQNEPYISRRKEARELRHRFLSGNKDTEARFLELISSSEEDYYRQGIAGFSPENRMIMERIDLRGEVEKRRDIFRLLHNNLIDFALWPNPDITTASPLCYPISIKDRDQTQAALKAYQIFAPVHWKLTPGDVPAAFRASHALSQSILSLPIRTHLPEEAYQHLIKRIKNLPQPREG
ncbi:MAG: hypothetical protein R6V49_09380 [Bacteroidales bacterium]